MNNMFVQCVFFFAFIQRVYILVVEQSVDYFQVVRLFSNIIRICDTVWKYIRKAEIDPLRRT